MDIYQSVNDLAKSLMIDKYISSHSMNGHIAQLCVVEYTDTGVSHIDTILELINYTRWFC